MAAITAMGGMTVGHVEAQFVRTSKFKIGYDDNLGLPNDFAEAIGREITAYHDLGQMIDAFVKQHLSGLFIPAGALPYIKQYDIVSLKLSKGTLAQMDNKLLQTSQKKKYSVLSQTFSDHYCFVFFVSLSHSY